jgi:hypothetical protein
MVLLASALILTLGLSASRITTTETKIDTDQELLKRAFNTAESGIDYYLATGDVNYSSNNSADGVADLNVTKLGGDVKTLSFNNITLVGSYEYFWLVNHNDDGSLGSTYYSTPTSTINICSSKKEEGNFKVDYFYLNGTTYGVSRQVLKSDSDGCIYNFSLSSGSPLLLTVSPITSAGKIEIEGANNFPIQGEQISATGKIEGVNNTVTVLNRYDVFLTEGLVSGGDVISK